MKPFTFCTICNDSYAPLTENMLTTFRAVCSAPMTVWVTSDALVERFSKFSVTVKRIPPEWEYCESQKEYKYGTRDFKMFSVNKIKALLEEFTECPLIWFVDGDIAFLKDPVPYGMSLPINEKIFFQCDRVFKNGRIQPNPGNELCTGNFLCRECPETNILLNAAIEYCLEHGVDDQQAFNAILKGTAIRTFDRDKMPNGRDFFDTKFALKEKVLIAHANWRIGNEKKIQALREMGLWRIWSQS